MTMKGDRPNKPQPPALTPIEFNEQDHDRAQEMATRLGYEQTAYTSSSALWGLFCLPENPDRGRTLSIMAAHSIGQVSVQDRYKPPYVHGCVIKLAEFGLVFVQTAEDLGFAWSDDQPDAKTCAVCGQAVDDHGDDHTFVPETQTRRYGQL